MPDTRPDPLADRMRSAICALLDYGDHAGDCRAVATKLVKDCDCGWPEEGAVAEALLAEHDRAGVTLTQPQPDHAITPECGPICMTTGHHHDPEACDGCRRLADVMHAAGAGVPVSGDGLDVERLRKALIACGWPTVSQPRYAARIARDYAVLRSTPVAPKEDNRE